MKELIICDTSIFLKLVEIDLLDKFFLLPWKIHTTDFIINGLKTMKDIGKFKEYCSKGILHVKEFTAKEMDKLIRFHVSKQKEAAVTLQDCSCWLLAIDNGYTFLTENRLLSNAAAKSNIDSYGIIYIIEKLKEARLLSKKEAVNKLHKLILFTPKLLLSEIETCDLASGKEGKSNCL